MKRTAIVFALFSEFLPTARSLGVPFFKAIQSQIILSERGIALVRSGMGKEKAMKAAEKIIREFRPEVIISAGFCGALIEDLKVGDVVVSDFSDSKIFCSPRPLFTYGEKISAHRQHKAIVVDMESEGIKFIAREYGIPFIAIKSVCDCLMDNLPKFPFGFTSLSKLIHFKRASDTASKQLSKFLLDYIMESHRKENEKSKIIS